MGNQYTMKKYTNQEIEKIKSLYNSGLSFTKISKLLGRNKNKIKKILIDNNLFNENRDKLKKDLNSEEIFNLYKKGLSLEKIAIKFNVSKTPVKRILKENNLLRSGYSDGKKIILSEEQKNIIKELYIEEYKNVEEISKELGLTESFINKYLSNSNYRRNKSEGVSIGLVKRYKGINYNEYLKNVDDYYKYKLEVLKITRQQPISYLENYDKRGKSGVEGAYQLDHKFSIVEGFKQNIKPEIIGNIINLEFIPWEENLNKRTKCSLTKEEIIIKFKKIYNG
jgi:IS30 family transposase